MSMNDQVVVIHHLTGRGPLPGSKRRRHSVGASKPAEGGAALTNDDVIHRSRLRLFALAREMGSVRAACRLLGVHHSTYYRWRRQLVRFGPELLRPRERRQPRMPNAISPMVEQRILALALA